MNISNPSRKPTKKTLKKEGEIKPQLSDIELLKESVSKIERLLSKNGPDRDAHLRRVTYIILGIIAVFFLLKGFKIGGFDLSDGVLVQISGVLVAPSFILRLLK